MLVIELVKLLYIFYVNGRITNKSANLLVIEYEKMSIHLVYSPSLWGICTEY
jgi:hypothetical protein